MVDDFPILVERHLKFQSLTGGIQTDIIIQIGYPKWIQPNLEASCPVCFRGDIGRVKDIVGNDPMEAIKNAILFTESYLQHRSEQVKFFWSTGEDYET